MTSESLWLYELILTFYWFAGEGWEGEVHDIHTDNSRLEQARGRLDWGNTKVKRIVVLFIFLLCENQLSYRVKANIERNFHLWVKVPYVSVWGGRWQAEKRGGRGCHWCPRRSCWDDMPLGGCSTDPWRSQLPPQCWTAPESPRPVRHTTSGYASLPSSCIGKEIQR